jgi:hypothetical protein
VLLPPTAAPPATEEVLFSTDYGRCWQHVPLAEALLVDNIRCAGVGVEGGGFHLVVAGFSICTCTFHAQSSFCQAVPHIMDPCRMAVSCSGSI